MDNEKDMLWSNFWTGFQSNNARISWSIRIKADWYKKGIIWLNIASLHMPWKSNQIFKTFKDVICFYNPNSLYDIYWTYPKQEQGLESWKEAEQNCKISKKSVRPISFNRPIQTIPRLLIHSWTSQEANSIVFQPWSVQNHHIMTSRFAQKTQTRFQCFMHPKRMLSIYSCS